MTSIFTALTCMAISHAIPSSRSSVRRVRNSEPEGGQIILGTCACPCNTAIFQGLALGRHFACAAIVHSSSSRCEQRQICHTGPSYWRLFPPTLPPLFLSLFIYLFSLLICRHRWFCIEWCIAYWKAMYFSCLLARQCAFLFFLPIGKAVCFCLSTAYWHGSVLLHVLLLSFGKTIKWQYFIFIFILLIFSDSPKAISAYQGCFRARRTIR